MADVGAWLDSVLDGTYCIYAKVLAANDTLANESHQLGVYIPNKVFTAFFPVTAAETGVNPRTTVQAAIESHGIEKDVNAIWYRPKKNESRFTNWGGKSSPIMDPESTGSICVFAVRLQDKQPDHMRVWLCESIEEEDVIRSALGEVESGVSVFVDPRQMSFEYLRPLIRDTPCVFSPSDVPIEWKLDFPRAEELVRRSIVNLPTVRQKSVDERIVRRRECEFQLFQCVETIVTMPRISEGFGTVDLFVQFANRVTNRRKSRSGASLELQTKAIFEEEAVSFSHGGETEDRKRPDFLFPSAAAYADATYPAEKLRLLGAKTTAKDRWRQLLDEGERVPEKHLLTLQLGISRNQFAQMKKAGVQLVVPAPLHSSYHVSIRPQLLSLEQFVGEVRAL